MFNDFIHTVLCIQQTPETLYLPSKDEIHLLIKITNHAQPCFLRQHLPEAVLHVGCSGSSYIFICLYIYGSEWKDRRSCLFHLLGSMNFPPNIKCTESNSPDSSNYFRIRPRGATRGRSDRFASRELEYGFVANWMAIDPTGSKVVHWTCWRSEEKHHRITGVSRIHPFGENEH